MMDFSKQKFRCSSLGALLTNPQGKKFEHVKTVDDLSETTKTELVKIFIQTRYGRFQGIKSKYLEKGIHQEEDSITLIARLKKDWYEKNTTRLENSFLSGEPDLFLGTSITEATSIIDTKTAWDIFTFLAVKTKPINKDYVYQLNGYGALTGARDLNLAYCLVNAPAHMITKAKKDLYFQMNCPDDQDPVYKAKCIEIEKNMIYDMQQFRRDNPGFDVDCQEWTFDVPLKERLIEFSFKRDDALIEQIYIRLKLCREWLNQFAQKYLPEPVLN